MRLLNGETPAQRNGERCTWIQVIVWFGPVAPLVYAFNFSVDAGLEVLRGILVFAMAIWSLGGAIVGSWLADAWFCNRADPPLWPFEDERPPH